MKPVLIQTLMKKKKKTIDQSVPDQLPNDKSSSLANFIFWALSALVILSLLLS